MRKWRKRERRIPLNRGSRRVHWGESYIDTVELTVNVAVVLNLFTLAAEHYDQPKQLEIVMDCSFYVVTAMLVFQLLFKLNVLGSHYFNNTWNWLDLVVVSFSILGMVIHLLYLEKLSWDPSMIRILSMLSLVQVLKTIKGHLLIRIIGNTLSECWNLFLLYLYFFFIYALLTVELFGALECVDDYPCNGLSRYANFHDFLHALLVLFKISTGDNWSNILKDVLRECRPEDSNCMDYFTWAGLLCLITFVIVVQFILINLIVPAIMQAMEECTGRHFSGQSGWGQERPQINGPPQTGPDAPGEATHNSQFKTDGPPQTGLDAPGTSKTSDTGPVLSPA